MEGAVRPAWMQIEKLHERVQESNSIRTYHLRRPGRVIESTKNPMRRVIYGVFWIGVYLFLILTPLVVLLIGPTPPGRSLWRELSVALGFVGLAMMGMQFFLTARVRAVTRPFGIDVVHHFHRQISLIAFFLVLAHPVILLIESPETLILLNPLTAPVRATAGVMSLLLLAILIVLSVWRLRLRINYEAWRLSHGILATTVVLLAVGHVIGVGYYVNEPYKQILWILLGVAWVSALVYTRLVKPLWLINRPYQVEELIQERGDTWTLALRPEGHKGMVFRPGQFAWLTIWRTPFSIREHPFSFSSSAMHPERLEFSIKELGDFTRKLKKVTPGTRAYLDGPYGVFTYDYYPASGYVFIAGGVGITPVVSMLRTAADRRDASPFLLVYGSPTWEAITFREELEELEKRVNLRVCHVLEQPPDGWTGETGFVNADLLARYLPEARLQYEYFICGPEPMLNAVDHALDQLGIPIEQTHIAQTLAAYETARGLSDYTRTTMPPDAPGALTDEEYWDVTAYMLAAIDQLPEGPVVGADTADDLILAE